MLSHKKNHLIFIISILIILTVLIISFYLNKDVTNVSDTRLIVHRSQPQEIKITGNNEVIIPPKVELPHKIILLGEKKINIEYQYTGCFYNTGKDGHTMYYSDLVLDIFTLPTEELTCLKSKFTKGKDVIRNGDIYLNEKDQLVFYGGTFFTGKDLIKLGSWIKN